MTLWQLFCLFVTTATFTFGGGYAMIPLLSDALVPLVLNHEEMSNVIALAQMTPGPVGLNAATYVGFKDFGLLGSLACTAGLVLPGIIIATLAAIFRQNVRKSILYQSCLRGIRPMVTGLIATVVVLFAQESVFTVPLKEWLSGLDSVPVCWQSLLIFLTVFYLHTRREVSVIKLMIIAATMGAVLFLI